MQQETTLGPPTPVMQYRKGDWIRTYTGIRFYPFDPRPEEIRIEDIAHSLSLQCRFTGHCNQFYSIAQHSVLVSYQCDIQDSLWGLLHDAAEAYLADVSWPVKQDAAMERYRQAERGIEIAIAKRFGLEAIIPRSVKLADEILLATEARDLMNDPQDWNLQANPLPARIIPWPHYKSKDNFLARFRKLTGAPSC